MTYKPFEEGNQESYNKVVNHPLQSYEWGQFREKSGVKVIRRVVIKDGEVTEGFTLTIHKVPKTRYSIGYLPKGIFPTGQLLDELRVIGKEENCILIQLEPNVLHSDVDEKSLLGLGLVKAAHPLFTKYNFVLDLTKPEEELVANLHPKTRYNIKIAKKHNVNVVEKNTDEAFQAYLAITEETTKRQKFYAHSTEYHKIQWETLPHDDQKPFNKLSSHLLIANYNNKTLATWMMFVFKNTLYYPYGASSSEHREAMASTMIMWEAIRYGKELGLEKFDMWGALGPDPDQLDSWYGFHRFKQGFRPDHVEYSGSFDLVIKPLAYQLYKGADKLRWLYLKVKK